MTPEILYEDNHLVVVNKPFGILTHGDRTGDPSMEDHVSQYIKEKYKKPGNVYCKSVHRLDRPVSGVLMFAKTSKGHERMAKQFKDRHVRKHYWALTHHVIAPEEGEVRQYLRKNYERNFVEYFNKPTQGAKECVTRYRLIATPGRYFLVELEPLTGRSHQLRVMMRSKGCSIIGDVKYKGRRATNQRAIMLHSRSLQFTHPVKKEPMTIVAPLPFLEEWDPVTAMLDKGWEPGPAD